jgi:hypothetical protein
LGYSSVELIITNATFWERKKKIKLQPKKARIKQNKEYIQKHFETERKSHQIAILKKKNLGG